jgi:glyoxylase-like metal-dependent hydrolase (beta-lactamase superfamily II)
MATWQVGTVSITRVAEPGFALGLPQDEETARVLRQQAWWLAPYLTDDNALRLGSAAVVLETPTTVIVVDPWLAFDGPDRHSPAAVERVERLLDTLGRSGFAPEDVDVVVNTHIDGLGANLRQGSDRSEVAAFPRARYLLAAAELDALRSGRRRGAGAFEVLVDEGRVDLLSGDCSLTAEVHLGAAPGHSAGHLAVRVASGGEAALIAGHVFLHPAQVFDPAPRIGPDEEPERAAATRRYILERCAADQTLLIGPLFADPGGGWVVSVGGSWWLSAGRPAATG